MSKGTTLTLVAALALTLATPSFACPVTQTQDGYSFTLPAEVAAEYTAGELAYLQVFDPQKGNSSVSGWIRCEGGDCVLETTELFRFPPTGSGTEIVLSRNPVKGPEACFPPEFFEGVSGPVCFCAGTYYCLPGECRCI